jgi:hypothetical protein
MVPRVVCGGRRGAMRCGCVLSRRNRACGDLRRRARGILPSRVVCSCRRSVSSGVLVRRRGDATGAVHLRARVFVSSWRGHVRGWRRLRALVCMRWGHGGCGRVCRAAWQFLWSRERQRRRRAVPGGVGMPPWWHGATDRVWRERGRVLRRGHRQRVWDAVSNWVLVRQRRVRGASAVRCWRRMVSSGVRECECRALQRGVLRRPRSRVDIHVEHLRWRVHVCGGQLLPSCRHRDQRRRVPHRGLVRWRNVAARRMRARRVLVSARFELASTVPVRRGRVRPRRKRVGVHHLRVRRAVHLRTGKRLRPRERDPRR